MPCHAMPCRAVPCHAMDMSWACHGHAIDMPCLAMHAQFGSRFKVGESWLRLASFLCPSYVDCS
eukprot:814500-Lingulodinium_polyedra.AAC.1